MSGDVQPRRRKDKKRKKEESIEQIPSQPPTPSTNQNEDVNIHVHKEDGTGGGICAKIIFFLLFSALAVLIGLIITEHRGLTDLDVVDQESRFSQLFEGWTDNSVGHDDHDDDDDHIANSLEEEEEDKEEAEESHEEEEDHVDAEEEDETHTEEEGEDEEEEEEEAEPSEEVAQSEEEEEEEVQPDEDESELKDADEDEEDEDVKAEEDGEEEELDVSKEVEDEEEEEDKAVSEELAEEKASEEAKDEEETQDELEAEKKEEDEVIEDDQQNSKMVVKIGVGVALLVVAHVVLVRKWKSANPTDESVPKEELPDLSRRNTIVVPPTYQEIEQDIEDNVEEEYSDEDGEVESDDERLETKTAKSKYQELRTTYSRSLTPESEPEYQSKPTEVDDEDYDDEEDEEVEEEEEDEEEESDEKEDEDENLLKRLEAKYGKLQREAEKKKKDDFDEQFSSWKRVNVRQDNEPEESDSDKQSDIETYEYENITNKDDYLIKEQIDEAHKNIKNNTAYALKLFDVLLQNHPFSPRSLYGKAQALDTLADQKRRNDILQKALEVYLKLLDLDRVPDALFEASAERCINRLRFIGHYNRAIDVHYKLIARFPQETKHRNQLVVSLLTINRVNKARSVLLDTLSKNPNDGFALVHYGFILKTVDNDLNKSIDYLQRGISTKAPGVIDGRFYFHLGDALARVGKTKEAIKIYEDGVKHKLFLSKYQRSLYNVPRLKGQPWWKKEETPYTDLYKALENNWKQIRDEGIAILNKNGQFQSESENLKDTGDWKQFELFARGQKNVNNCKKCPVTCKIIESTPDARGCRRGQTKFSVMHPGTHVWPHCGPTNCRLRIHLGLKVPQNTYIRVAEEVRSWKDGEVLIFDDSFEHEVWHNGTSLRLVLIVDVWHPELTPVEKRSLSPI